MIKSTLVQTPSGAKKIIDLKQGDLVYDEFGKPVQVKKVFPRGKNKVVDLKMAGRTLATCSIDQQLLVKECCGHKQFIAEVKSISNFKSDNKVVVHLDGYPFGTGFAINISDSVREEDTYGLDIDSTTNLYLLENGLIAYDA